MAFQYACFLSYRHSDSQLGQRAVEDFEQALRDELGLLNHLPIYHDVRNKPGYRYQEVIATALCQSVCMVMIYWPEYFSHEHHYCTREYRAMVMLEQKRLALLPPTERHLGLIIPVMIRGHLGLLPAELRDTRMCAEFTELYLTSRPMNKHKKFAPRVREIAEYIHNRWCAFMALGLDPCSECLDFALPTYDDVKGWLDTVAQPPPWILRGRP